MFFSEFVGEGCGLLPSGKKYVRWSNPIPSPILKGDDRKARGSSRRLMSISHIVGLGQSNEQGAQSEPVISGQALGYDALMFARGVQTRLPHDLPAAPELRNPWDFFFWPLTPAVHGPWMGETPAMGMISQMVVAYRELRGRDAALAGTDGRAHFLYTFPHMGGKHLAELDWRDFETHPANPSPGPGGYHATFVDDIRRARVIATGAGLTYEVIAFHLTQGENEGLGYLLPGGPLLSHSAFVSAYRADLEAAYVRWDVDARAITGQRQPIPLFISQVDNCWAGQAQAQLADERADLFLVGPIYYVPSALNSQWNGTLRGHQAHLSADGQRWRGEQIGKVMSRVLFDSEEWRPLQPTNIRRTSDTVIVLRFNVPRPPLVFETDWLPKAFDYGFAIYLGTQDAPGARRMISSVTITGPDEVTVTLDPQTPLSEGAASFITYGQTPTVGVTTTPVQVIQPGMRYENGEESTEVLFEGDLRVHFEPLLVEGCFVLRQLIKPNILVSTGAPEPFFSASIVVRDVRYESGTTIVRGETRSIDHALIVGEICSVERDRPFGNLRDSDSALANFTFTDASYGTRYGQPYPLQNFCIIFTNPIEERVSGELAGEESDPAQ